MNRSIATEGGYSAAIMNDNHIMTGSAASPLRRILRAPFTRRAWAELGYTLVTLPLAIAGAVYAVAVLANLDSRETVRGLSPASTRARFCW